MSSLMQIQPATSLFGQRDRDGHLESILPEKLIAATAAGEAVVVLLDKPEFDQPPSRSRFDVVWNELMPNPIIPFDRDVRRSICASV